MKNAIYMCRVILVYGVIALMVSCGSSDDVLSDYEEQNNTTYEEQANTSADLLAYCKQWGCLKTEIGNAVSSSSTFTINTISEEYTQYTSKDGSMIFGFRFYDNKLCASAVLFKEGSGLGMSSILSGFEYHGEMADYDGKEVYSDSDANTFATAYELSDSDEVYSVIGFTPLLTIKETANGVECTDLGLSKRWATCNIGANASHEYGGYYMWGETEERDTCTSSCYTYYKKNLADSICGTIYDVVTTKYGGSWIMPTDANWNEIISGCTWVYTQVGDIKGYKIFGDNGNYIFLPSCGYKTSSSITNGNKYGYYWSSTEYDTNNAERMYFSSTKFSIGYRRKYYGQCVRGVTE